LLVSGYTLILVIDKVLFDTHAILGHDDEGHAGSGSTLLRKSVMSIMAASMADGNNRTS
jgi:hypothetical protein